MWNAISVPVADEDLVVIDRRRLFIGLSPSRIDWMSIESRSDSNPSTPLISQKSTKEFAASLKLKEKNSRFATAVETQL